MIGMRSLSKTFKLSWLLKFEENLYKRTDNISEVNMKIKAARIKKLD